MGRPHAARWLALATPLLVALLLVAPVRAASGSTPGANGGTPPGGGSTVGLTATVTWNGANVASAGSVSSALGTQFGSPIQLLYSWSSSSGQLWNISDARLQVFYFGLPLGTRDQVDSTPLASTSGSFVLNWDPGSLRWLVAGAFGVTVSLLDPNGTVVWSEPFFVDVHAPGGVGAVLPILLILIAIYELYGLARSGRDARAKSGAKSEKSSPSPDPPSPSDPAPPKDGGA